MNPIEVEVVGEIGAPIETVFDVLMPIDVTRILTGRGPMPAVIAIEDQTGDWNSIGESRIIRMGDGHAMLETLTGVDRPHSFTYTLSNLTNVLRLLVRRFHGTWKFESLDSGEGAPSVWARWHYSFEPRSALTRPLSWLILRLFWRPYMAEALERARQIAVEEYEASGKDRSES